MNNAPIRILIFLATVAMIGIIATQTYWANRAVLKEKQEFSHSVQMALFNVVESLCQIDGNDIPLNNPVDRISNNYFIVRTNNKISLPSLEFLLKAEFEKRAILQDFEYGVYDCEDERMVHGNLVQLSEEPAPTQRHRLPTLDNEAYYFGIFFPERSRGFLDLDFWRFTTLLTIIVLVFLGYGLLVILRQKRLSVMQRDFVNNITHEFKTPIATLKVASEVFENAPDEPAARLKKYGEIVSGEVRRLESHVEQILKSSLVESSAVTDKEPIDLKELLDKIILRFKPVTEEKGISLSAECPIDQASVLGNRDLLEAVFFNLLDNAVKYGGPEIRLSLSMKRKHLQVTVWDSGKGIPKSLEKKIFRKFQRGSSGNLHDTKGFGLGLHFVRNVLRKHGATIRVNQGEGFGLLLTFKAYES